MLRTNGGGRVKKEVAVTERVRSRSAYETEAVNPSENHPGADIADAIVEGGNNSGKEDKIIGGMSEMVGLSNGRINLI
jgi:hypothetical protein